MNRPIVLASAFVFAIASVWLGSRLRFQTPTEEAPRLTVEAEIRRENSIEDPLGLERVFETFDEDRIVELETPWNFSVIKIYEDGLLIGESDYRDLSYRFAVLADSRFNRIVCGQRQSKSLVVGDELQARESLPPIEEMIGFERPEQFEDLMGRNLHIMNAWQNGDIIHNRRGYSAFTTAEDGSFRAVKVILQCVDRGEGFVIESRSIQEGLLVPESEQDLPGKGSAEQGGGSSPPPDPR